MNEKIEIIKKIFSETYSDESAEEMEPGVKALGIMQHGEYYGGVYNGRKYMYSRQMIESMPEEKLESFIRGQLGIPT